MQHTACGTISSASIWSTALILSHGYHRVPTVPQLAPDAELLQRAAEYVDAAIRIFDEATGTSLGDPAALDVLDRELRKMPWPPGNDTDRIS